MGSHSSLSSEDLIRICAASGEAVAWEEFVRRFERLIASVAIRTARTWGELSRPALDDLIQETYLKLCANDRRLLREFDPHHAESFYGYLKVITANVVKDHFKSTYSKKRGSAITQELPEEIEMAAPRGSAGSPSSMERNIVMKEVQAQLEAVTAGPDQKRNCTIFWLHHHQGMTSSAIASIPGIGLTAKGVESTLQRLTRAVRERMAADAAAKPQPRKTLNRDEGILPAESF